MLVASALKTMTSSMFGKLAPGMASMGEALDDSNSASSSLEAHNFLPAAAAVNQWAAARCCSSCGATRAPLHCTQCDQHLCTACAAGGGPALAPAASEEGAAGASACSGCSSMCYSCRPLTCGICPQQPPAKMCDACFDECDQCGRLACPACTSRFARCERCEYSLCQGCSWEAVEAQPPSPAALAAAAAAAALGSPKGGPGGSGVGSTASGGWGSQEGGGALGGCWCDGGAARAVAGINSADRAHQVVQRYHMSSATHPRLLARSMEAAGLRDAEDEGDEEEGGGDPLGEEDEGGRASGGDWGPSSLDMGSLSSSWGPRGAGGMLRTGSMEAGGPRVRTWLL